MGPITDMAVLKWGGSYGRKKPSRVLEDVSQEGGGREGVGTVAAPSRRVCYESRRWAVQPKPNWAVGPNSNALGMGMGGGWRGSPKGW
jgi:hypothetical protein